MHFLNIRARVMIISLFLILSIPSLTPPESISQAQPSQGQIVYFVSEPNSKMLSSVYRQSSSNSLLVSSWSELLKVSKGNITALVIDNMTLSKINTSWLSSAYSRGMVIAGINIPGITLAQSVGSPCAIDTNSFRGAYYVAMFRVIITENAKDRYLIEDAERENCGEGGALGVEGHAIYSAGIAASELQTEQDFDELNAVLNVLLLNVRESHHLPASTPRNVVCGPIYFCGETVSGDPMRAKTEGYAGNSYQLTVQLRAWAEGGVNPCKTNIIRTVYWATTTDFISSIRYHAYHVARHYGKHQVGDNPYEIFYSADVPAYASEHHFYRDDLFGCAAPLITQ